MGNATLNCFQICRLAAACVLGSIVAASAGAEEAGYGLRAGLFDNLRAGSFGRSGDGLPNNRVLDIAQDTRGFIWLATQNGLARFDGHRVVSYFHDPGDPTSLPDSYVKKLHVDRQGRLWVGTFTGGLARFDDAAETFVRLARSADGSDGLCGRDILGLHERADFLWVATDGGLNVVDLRDHRVHAPALDGATCSGRVESLAFDQEGNVLIGADEGVIWVESSETSREPPDVLRARDRWSVGEVTLAQISWHPSYGFWIGSDGGLFRLRSRSGRLERFDLAAGAPGAHGNHVLTVHVDRAERVWIGTGDGIKRLDPETGVVRADRHDPADAQSPGRGPNFTIFEDRTGLLWFGNDDGVSRLDPRREAFTRFRHHPVDEASLALGTVVTMVTDAQDRLWVASMGGGLSRLSAERKQATRYVTDSDDITSLSHDFVWVLFEDRAGTLWAGTEVGLDRYDPSVDGFRHLTSVPDDPTTLGGQRVLSLLEDRRGHFWVGTGAGLDRLDRATGRVERIFESAPVMVIVEDDHDALWLATDGGGLGRYDPLTEVQTWYRAADDGLAHDVIVALHLAPDGRLWMGTLGGGLQRFDPAGATFETFRRTEGLPSDSIKSVLPDDGGNLWLGTDRGIVRFTPETGGVEVFTARDGALDQATSKSGFRGPDGELFFGGGEGLVAFFPSAIERNTTPPLVALTGLSILNRPVLLQREDPSSPLERSIDHSNHLSLDHRQYLFSLELAALDFSDPSRNRYAHQLEGFDPDWIETDASRRFAVYSNLPAGTYTFRARASNADGVWSASGPALRIEVQPPPWRTKWAYLLYGLILLAIVGAFVRLLLRLRDANRRLESLVVQRTDQVEALGGLLPICASCKKVRDDKGYWDEVEAFFGRHGDLTFTHGLCPGCADATLREMDEDRAAAAAIRGEPSW